MTRMFDREFTTATIQFVFQSSLFVSTSTTITRIIPPNYVISKF